MLSLPSLSLTPWYKSGRTPKWLAWLTRSVSVGTSRFAVNGARFGDEDKQGSGDDGDLGVTFDQFAPAGYLRFIGFIWRIRSLLLRVVWGYAFGSIIHGADSHFL